MKLPSNYLPVMPYLILKDAHQFAEFMKDIFDAKLQEDSYREDKTIMHAELAIGDAIIMFAEASDQYRAFPASIFLYVKSVEPIFKKIKEKNIPLLQDIEDRPYGRGGGFQDPYGNQWWVNQPPTGS